MEDGAGAIEWRSAATIAAATRAGEVSVREVVQAHLDLIGRHDAVLNAVVTRCDEAALERAAVLDDRLANGDATGPLHGVPMTVKDCFDTAGVRTTAGTLGWAERVPERTAAAVARLEAAGAVLLGKTNTPDLTLWYETDNLLFGPTWNPYDPARSPGGSSGGAAAVLASGGSALEVGSDTAGSIRLPAHFCGIAGLKPSAGRVPRTGLCVPPGTPVDQLTQVGPMARTVADLRLALSLMAGPDGRDPGCVPLAAPPAPPEAPRGLRVGLVERIGELDPDADTSRVLGEVGGALADAGAVVGPAASAELDRTSRLYRRVFTGDGQNWIRRLLRAAGTTRTQILDLDAEADPVFAAKHVVALEDLARFRAGMLALLDDHDVLVAPVFPSVALPPGELTSDERFPGFAYSQAFSLLGWPVAVVRAGTSSGGLPIGVQVAAPPCRDLTALAVAERIESALGGFDAPQVPSEVPPRPDGAGTRVYGG